VTEWLNFTSSPTSSRLHFTCPDRAHPADLHGRQGGTFVGLQRNAVAQVGLLERREPGSASPGDSVGVDPSGRDARRDRGHRGLQTRLDGAANGLLSSVRLAHHCRSGQARVVALVDAAQVEAHQLAAPSRRCECCRATVWCSRY
jgi:hypothetical protein